MIKVRLKRNPTKVAYFKFFASQEFPDCFWHTPHGENVDFLISRVGDWEPVKGNWEDIRKQETKKNE